MNEERDKFLTEAMEERYHGLTTIPCKYSWSPDGQIDYYDYKCFCNQQEYISYTDWINEHQNKNIDFSTWSGFGKLAVGLCVILKWTSSQVMKFVEIALPIDDDFPDRFADAIYKFLGGNN